MTSDSISDFVYVRPNRLVRFLNRYLAFDLANWVNLHQGRNENCYEFLERYAKAKANPTRVQVFREWLALRIHYIRIGRWRPFSTL